MQKIFLIASFFIFLFISCESKTSQNDNENINDPDIMDSDFSEITDHGMDMENNDIGAESDIVTDDFDNNDEEPDNDSEIYLKAPENLKAEDGLSHNRILVTWDKMPDSPKVFIYRSESESGPFESLDTWTTGNDFSDENIILGKKYYYKAKASYTINKSEFSNMDSGFSLTDNSEYEFALTYGEEGGALGQFQNPTGIEYFDSKLFIADTDNNRIQSLNPENLHPVDQIYLGFNCVYAGISYNSHYSEFLFTTGFSEEESFIYSVYYFDFNYNPKEANIKMLYDLASSKLAWNVNGESMGLTHVTDKENSKIHVFNLTSYNEECNNDLCLLYVKSFGSEGSEESKLDSPSGVAIFDNMDYWSFSYLFVVDSGNDRINVYQMYTGSFIFSFGKTGSDDGEFNNPTGIAISDKGYIFITDSGNNRVQKFSLGGHFITKFGESGSGEGQFNNPAGITTDEEGNIYVVDKGNNRIQKFKPVSQ